MAMNQWDYRRGIDLKMERVQAKLDAQAKADDPLLFYWRRGVRSMRDDFGRLLDFNPKPEDFYNEGNYSHG